MAAPGGPGEAPRPAAAPEALAARAGLAASSVLVRGARAKAAAADHPGAPHPPQGVAAPGNLPGLGIKFAPLEWAPLVGDRASVLASSLNSAELSDLLHVLGWRVSEKENFQLLFFSSFT